MVVLLISKSLNRVEKIPSVAVNSADSRVLLFT